MGLQGYTNIFRKPLTAYKEKERTKCNQGAQFRGISVHRRGKGGLTGKSRDRKKSFYVNTNFNVLQIDLVACSSPRFVPQLCIKQGEGTGRHQVQTGG